MSHGRVTVASGPVYLAAQGLQQGELRAFPHLANLTSAQQQDFAGNAFTANVCAAYILAAMLCM